MLFNYQYVNHDIEKFQEYVKHLVKEVWCNADGDFSIDHLHPDLRQIVLQIYNTEENTTRGRVDDWLYGPIREIYDLFKSLDPEQRQQISNWFDNNNDIEALCACDTNKPPARYADIRAINPDLEKALKHFSESLFTNVINLRAVTSLIGEIDEHYTTFVAQNTKGKCPYCGYNDIKGPHHSIREAYDHFLPKGTYPFNSVNFRNLAPMCHECNSGYKLQKDPIHSQTGGNRRKAFYSYATMPPDITINVTLKTQDILNLSPDGIDIDFAAPGHEEEVETWKTIFGIEMRYKAKFCAENDGIAWLQEILDEAGNYGQDKNAMLTQVVRAADRSPYDSVNFLKKPFLMACLGANII